MNNITSFFVNNKIQTSRRDHSRQANDNTYSHSQDMSKSDNFVASASANKVRFGSKNFVVDGITKSMNAIEHGGKMAEFMVLDFVSMVLPRAYLGFTRNQKELGHLNYKAGLEDTTRELVTGPSMFLIPMAFIAVGKKLAGKSIDLTFNTLSRFKQSSDNVLKDKSDKAITGKEFYKQVFNDAFDLNDKLKLNISDTERQKTASDLADKMGDIAKNNIELSKKENKPGLIDKVQYFFNGKSSSGKMEKSRSIQKQITDTKNYISDTVLKLNKKANNFDRPELLNLGNNKTEKIGNLVSDMLVYSGDIIDKYTQKAKTSAKDPVKLFNQIHDKVRASRMAMVVSAILTTGVFLYLTPKMYQRSKSYPGLEGLTCDSNSSKGGSDVNKK